VDPVSTASTKVLIGAAVVNIHTYCPAGLRFCSGGRNLSRQRREAGTLCPAEAASALQRGTRGTLG